MAEICESSAISNRFNCVLSKLFSSGIFNILKRGTVLSFSIRPFNFGNCSFSRKSWPVDPKLPQCVVGSI